MQQKKMGSSLSKYVSEIHNNMNQKGHNYSLDEYSNVIKKKLSNKFGVNVDSSEIKKILNKLKNKTKGVDEFIDSDGSFIEGDWNPNRRETFVGKNRPETSREFAMFTAQGPRYYYTPHYGASRVYTKENIAENKMKSMIEDIVTKKFKDDDVLEKDFGYSEIPNVADLKNEYQKPIIARKTKYLGDMMEREGVGGEEIAIVLNYLLSKINVEEIPAHYKKILINKLKNG